MKNTLRPTQWIEQCALVLHERWHTVAPDQLEEVAIGIWGDEYLRRLPPAEAATSWLAPVATSNVVHQAANVDHVAQ